MSRLAGLALTLLACGAEEPPPSTFVGHWVPSQDALFDAYGPLSPLLLLTLDADGTGELTWGLPDGARRCLTMRWSAPSDDALLFDLEIDELATLLYDGLYGATLVADTLSLRDELDRTAALRRVAAPAPGTRCQRFEATSRLAGLPRPSYDTGLVVLDGAFAYDRDDADALHLLTDPPVDLPMTGARDVYAVIDDRLWLRDPLSVSSLRCRLADDTDCGGFDLAGLLPGATEVTAATAVDGTLVVHGRTSPGEGRYVQLDPEGPLVQRVWPSSNDPSALAWDGAHLWALASESGGPLLRINLDSGAVEQTWRAPALSWLRWRWRAVAADADGSLVLLTETEAGGELFDLEVGG